MSRTMQLGLRIAPTHSSRIHAGREKTLREYCPEKYHERLMAVYEEAIELGASKEV